MARTNCRNFNGYKPCGLNINCNESCSHFQPAGMNIVIIHLGALGAVLRATCLLKPIKRAYPQSQITWVTDAPAQHLLANNPLIDKVYTSSPENIQSLMSYEFDLGFCIDKATKAVGISRQLNIEELKGFSTDANASILPINQEARELWELGLNDHKKFFINKKPETQLMTEALGLEYQRDDYLLALTADELNLGFLRRSSWSEYGKYPIIGINTGCSNFLPYKKMSVEKNIELVRALNKNFSVKVVLLGGPEDTIRNQQIAEYCDAIVSPTTKGIRDGLSSVAACDMVISGDSLGMHMAIALKKHTIAWFGSTCAHEIDLFERGEKILSRVSCGPCWKRSCDKEKMCHEMVSLKALLLATKAFLAPSSKDSASFEICLDLNLA
ncbi:MAG: glycosyltransferase family 9 protein [Bdellovibrionota bacterium]|nr:glycosyltransferase family 9 protein [Bdellovibrionota bacterium]